MAAEKEPSCHNNCVNDPNFAIICSFFDRFGSSCGITYPTFSELQEMIENYEEVPPELIDLHVKLLRKIRRSVSAEKWERVLIKFCHSYYCSEEGWELERGGYKKCKIPARLRILKTLLDAQFDLNSKLKTDINKLSAEELRLEPLGRDKVGQSYWCQFDSAANVRVYKEDQDEETWKLVAKNREGLVDLITQLSSGEELLGLELINEEDSNSQEVEKPIIDTGQVEMTTSEENTADNISSIDTNIENNVKNEDQLDSNNHPENKLSVEVKINTAHNEKNDCDKSENNSSEKEIVGFSSKETLESNLENAEDDDCSKNVPNRELESVQSNADNSNLTSSNLECNELTEENSIEKCNSTTEKETGLNKTLNTEGRNSNLSQSSETDRIDVTEEIKQRSLVKSNSTTVFKGKLCKPYLVSKLDKIFSHKLESSNIISAGSSTSITKPSHVEEEQLKVPHINQSTKEDEEAFHKETIKHIELQDSDHSKRKEREFENSLDCPLYKKQCLGTELSEEVGEEIEEPVMLIKGEGSGQDCDTGNLRRENENIVSKEIFCDEVEEEIEEPIMIIRGEGYGQDCDTGNASREGEEDVETTEKINIVTPNTIVFKNIVNEQQISSDNRKSSNENSNDDERDGIDLITREVENNGNNRGVLINDIDKAKESFKLNEIICKDSKTLIVNSKLKEVTSNICESQINSQSDKDHETSIEEQLSFLTGESLSPQQNSNENVSKTESIQENSSYLLNNYSDKGVRRKSKEYASQDDKDAIPPEAKKTKVGNDRNENVDCLDTNSTQLADIIDTLMGKKDNSTDNKLNSKHVEVSVKELSSCNSQTINYVNSVEKNESNKSQGTSIEDISTSINNSYAEVGSEELSSSNSKIKTDESSDMEGESNNGQDILFQKNDDSTLDLNQLTENEKKNQKFTGNNKKTANKNADKTNSIEDTSSKHNEVNENPSEKDSLFQENIVFKESPINSSNAVDGQTTSTSLGKKTADNIASNSSTVADNNDLNTENSVKNTVTNKSNKIEQENETNLLKSENNIESSSYNSILKCEKNSKTLEKKPTPKKSPRPRRKIFTPKSRKRIARALENSLKKETTIENSSEDKETIQSKKKGGRKDDTNQKSYDEQQNTINSESQMDVIDNIITKNNSALKENRKRRSTRRNTGTEKDSEEDAVSDKKEEENKDDVDELEIGGKKRKIKGKRATNKALRKTIEEKRKSNSSSEEENQIKDNVPNLKKSPLSPKQRLGKGKNTIKNNGKKNSATSVNKKKEDDESSNEAEVIVQASKKNKTSKSQGRNSRAFLGIDLNIDISETSRSVRQSSRLAQIKIKEQVDNKIVDESHKKSEKSPKKSSKKKVENEEKQKGTPKKQKKTKMEVSEDDIQEEEPLSDRKKKKKKKKKNPVKAFNERDPWKSSSGSSSEAEEEEEEYHFDDIVEEEEYLPITIKSDHEFSPESDLEGDEEVKPIRHARTAQKVSDPSAEEGDVDDFACEKCGKKDHPEWILLCDTCDRGWHASCLRPSLMLIPEGDWHCPTCQHAVLVKKLQETLKIFDRDSKRRENEELRKKRLAYVGISLDNVLPSNAHPHHPHEAIGSGSESSGSSESESRSESEESDEPVYQLRQRRQGTNTYRFSEFDELINSAIQDEVAGKNAVFGVVPENANQSAEKPEEKVNLTENKDKESKEVNGLEESKPLGPCDEKKEDTVKSIKKDKGKSDEDEESSSEEEDKEDDEEEEFPHVVPKRVNILPRPGKKKHRRLNCLDDASDDDDGSDEDFKGSSSEEEDEEEEEEDSDESGAGRRRSKRGFTGPVRRSSRTRRSRFDKEFINDNSDESDAPRRKKTRKLWSESDSESDDSTWGRRKKKKHQGSSGRRRFKKNRKFVIEDELSETETSKVPKKKRQRKVKYGGLDILSVEDLPSRRTRGKKINYQEVLGSDSDEEIQKSKNVRKAVINDDEFVAEKEEKRDSESSSSGEDEDREVEENSGDGQSNDEKVTDKKSLEGDIQKKDSTKGSSVKAPPLIIRPVEDINKDKFGTAKKVKPPKAMIAPPPERLVSEDEQYKAIVSKVSTLTHSESDIKLVRPVNFNDQSNSSSESKDFADHSHHLTPIKIQNSSVDQKLMKRSPPIKIRSGVPVNAAGRRSPLASPTSEISFFPVKPTNLEPIHSPPEKIQSELGPQKSQGLIQASAQQFVASRKSVDSIIKTEKLTSEVVDNADEDDYLDDIEEEEEDDEDDSEDDVLEEGEIPKKVARRMARMEEQMLRQQEVRITSQVKTEKPVQPSGSLSPGAVQSPTSSASEQKPTQPLLRVVSPLKLMANPPGPLQSSFLNSGMSTRMPLSSPPGQSRMAMAIRPPQPTNMMPGINIDDGSPKRRGRGRGKKQPEKPDQEMMAGGSVIRGMLQQPQSYPPTHYPQQYPPHPRIPFNPQRMPRSPFHPGHHPLDPSPSGGGTINIKQEPVSNPTHIPNKPPPSSGPPYHPTAAPPHRFDSAHHRQPNYPPQAAKTQYNSYPPPPGPSTNYHYGNYPPPLMTQREEPQGYPAQQPYNEQYTEQPASVAPNNKTSPEDDSGEFGGLVSYFSSQREEELDT